MNIRSRFATTTLAALLAGAPVATFAATGISSTNGTGLAPPAQGAGGTSETQSNNPSATTGATTSNSSTAQPASGEQGQQLSQGTL